MILSNTVASSVVLNGATSTVNTPADESAPLGFMPGSNGESWVALPGPCMAINALGALTATGATLDCSLYGYFSWTAYAGAFTLTLANATIGQVIQCKVTGAAGTPTWPGATITWVGTVAAGTGSASAPLQTAATAITLVCTGYNTYDGTYTVV